MDLLACYDDDDDVPVPSAAPAKRSGRGSKPAPVVAASAAPAVAAPATVARPEIRTLALVSAAPSVELDHTLTRHEFANAAQKMVFHNPGVDYMWTPMQVCSRTRQNPSLRVSVVLFARRRGLMVGFVMYTGPSTRPAFHGRWHAYELAYWVCLVCRHGCVLCCGAHERCVCPMRTRLHRHVEKHQLDSHLFDAQYHTFGSYGYAADPSSLVGASAGKLIGRSGHRLDEMGGASVYDATSAAARRAAHEGLRKRKDGGDASEPSSYLGPWAPYEVEEVEARAFAVAKAERERLKAEEEAAHPELAAERKAAEAAKAAAKAAGTSDSEFDRNDQAAKRQKGLEMAVVERTLFHGDAVLDYQGRTYLHAPTTDASQQDKEAGGHACYIPEGCVHTWSGHTKGVSAIRFLPTSGHLLLSASMDNTIKIWDVYNKRKCLRSYLGHNMAVKDIQFTHDGRQFLSTSFDRYIKVLSIVWVGGCVWVLVCVVCLHLFCICRLPGLQLRW